jgi:hypothetical protein
MEGPGPGDGGPAELGRVPHRLAADALNPSRHFGGGPARERHQEDAPGVRAAHDEPGHPVGQGLRLPGPGPGDDQERAARLGAADAVFDGSALGGIQVISRLGRLHGCGSLAHGEMALAGATFGMGPVIGAGASTLAGNRFKDALA